MTEPLGIIGGSGLYRLADFANIDLALVDTPFGKPSDGYVTGTVGDQPVIFLPRHGRNHDLLPSEINHRANLYGFRELGVRTLVSVTAVGSLREAYRPGDILIPDQYFDRTKKSAEHTFFGRGLVAHVGFGEPTCRHLRTSLLAAAREVAAETTGGDIQIHDGGTYVNMEGPAFSTRAESNFYRGAGFDVIGMTSLPEAKLAREAQICYAAMAMITDYDCWHESEEDVSAEAVLDTVRANTSTAQTTLVQFVQDHRPDEKCTCRSSLEGAVMTEASSIPDAGRSLLSVLKS